MTTRPMKRILLAGLAAVAFALPARAQTLTIMNAVESQHHDPARQTAGSAVMYLVGDTLVSLDFDLRTVKPLLAKSWTVSPDGKLYTFKLRDDVTFCSGKKFTADDVVYTFKRVLDKDLKSPMVWRMGKVKDIRAPDPYTIEYELEVPFSELLPNLTIFHATILNKENVEGLGKDFGVKGFDGTGPYCWQSWEPRNETIMIRHEAYKWGPPIYENKGPAKYQRIVMKVVPEEAARLAALASGQMDISTFTPDQYLPQIAKMPTLQMLRPAAELRLFYLGLKISRENLSDVKVRTALNLAVDRKPIVDSVYFGNGEPASTYIHPKTPDFDPNVPQHLGKYDPVQAGKLLDEAGWKMGPDQFRYKDGKKLTLQLYGFAGGRSPKVAEAVQGYWRKIGVDLQLQMWDGTIVFSKLAQQDYDIWSIAYPYASAGDAMMLYFNSNNVPTPNRMNWKDPETDKLLEEGAAALSDEKRFEAFAKVQKIVHENALWVPLVHEGVVLVANKRVKNLKAHNIYATNMLYKLLDAGP
jgi:peptide/nickel transport system substrate-binding protein